MIAIDEELLHISAPSRLDYFKSGCQFDKRVKEKRKQIVAAAGESGDAGAAAGGDAKRAKTADT